jgi:hypothetical protein
MTLQTALARIAEIDTALAPPPPARAPAGAGNSDFARVLQQAGVSMTTPAGPLALGGGATGALAAARGEVGQAEQPPGSNDSPRIAQYRSVNGGGVGPWCAYFVSWAAAQGGTPLGDDGRGFASVDQLYAWAQSNGRAVPAGAEPPRPGDLIVWDEHVGIVEGVLPDGSVQTIEGNSSDRVSRRTHPPDGGGAIGYVRVG